MPLAKAILQHLADQLPGYRIYEHFCTNIHQIIHRKGGGSQPIYTVAIDDLHIHIRRHATHEFTAQESEWLDLQDPQSMNRIDQILHTN
ncbi:hypothetical protein [Rhodopirellula halodulae]|uniref:hypothetical protein n=1 Tax=Rhodopirellula halodulae TaxID=2894198 RepID=UPI001E445FDC|nr:hypothetical protein [Rhodopirellula sp. JC737]MCC9655298.1 hypothetical protein [Rhodopirellula sp. JC737]